MSTGRNNLTPRPQAAPASIRRSPHGPEHVEGRLSAYLYFAAALAILNSAFVTIPTCYAADGRGWAYEPYQIHAVLALDLPGGLSEHLAEELPAYLGRRVNASIAPLWTWNLKLADRPTSERILREIDTMSEPPDAGFPADGDKLLLLTVDWTPDGYTLTAREFDRLVARWGMPVRLQSQQLESLPEQLFALVAHVVAPLAQFEVDPNNDRSVTLTPRGALLPRRDGAAAWSKKGDVFLPVLRRTSRGGQLVENGIQPVPWTYLETTAVEPDQVVARIESGNRRPFGVRRQGRVEQLAIALRADPVDTMLQLRSRTAKEKPLVGYDVFAQNVGNEQLERVGVTNRIGQLEIPPGKTRIQFLSLKHGGQLLARIPIVPGADRQINVPLPDDDTRLAAEARLSAMREDLIDVVARRNILIARARQKIEKKDLAGAQELLRALDELPGRPQFDLTLNTSKRQLRSDDPQMQRRIDQLFNATQTLMAQFLDVRSVSLLHEELREAQK